jgi:hypothetical protein
VQDHEFQAANMDVRYQMPLELGIVQPLPPNTSLCVQDIIDRIHAHNERFKKKCEKKKIAEDQYYQQRSI